MPENPTTERSIYTPLSEPITIRVPVLPRAQPRQRHRIAQSKAGKMFSRNYTPGNDPVHDFKATVRMAAHAAYQGPPIEGPVCCDVTFVFPRTTGQIWKKKPMPRIWHVKKPDRDNLDKALADALTGLIWKDDCQVCDGRIKKCIAAGDEQPHVEIVITQITEV